MFGPQELGYVLPKDVIRARAAHASIEMIMEKKVDRIGVW